MTFSALPEWLVATRESLHAELGSLSEEESLLLAEATAALRDTPHRVYPLGECPGDAALLSGLLSLRLYIMHESLNPLVTNQRAVASARRLTRFLYGHERRERIAHEERAQRAQAPRLDGCGKVSAPIDLVALRYDTLAALNPPPHALLDDRGAVPNAPCPHEDPLSPVAITDLVERWERARASESLGGYLRKKLSQNIDFFRHGFWLPAYWWRRQRIRRELTPALRQNRVVMETYFAIEQVGPIIDGFVFRAGGSKLERSVGVADFAFLYMQMADELVDNLVHHLGSDGVRQLVNQYHPRSMRKSLLIPFENLSDEILQAARLDPATHISKYGVSFSKMMSLLRELRSLLVQETKRAEAAGCPRVAAELQDFFHHCFGTYLDELFLPTMTDSGQTPDQLPLSDVQWHFFRKNNLVMMRYMALRARLTGLDPAAHGASLQRWGYLLAAFQVFDDMKDVWVDFGFQPNYALQSAASLFPAEYAWLGANLTHASAGSAAPVGVTRDEVIWLNAHVPRTLLHCFRLSRLMALFCFDYLAMYAWDHRWRKNWLSRYRAFNPEGPHESAARAWLQAGRQAVGTGTAPVDTFFTLCSTLALRGEDMECNERLAFLLDALAYEHPSSVYRATLPSPRRFYRYATLRMMLPAREKVSLLGRWLRRNAPAVRRGLTKLRAMEGNAAPDARSLVRVLDGLLEPRATRLEETSPPLVRRP